MICNKPYECRLPCTEAPSLRKYYKVQPVCFIASTDFLNRNCSEIQYCKSYGTIHIHTNISMTSGRKKIKYYVTYAAPTNNASCMKEQETRCKRCRHICIQSRSRVSQKPTVNSPTVYYVVVLATRSAAKEPHPFYDCSRRLLIHAADIACPCDRCCCSGCAGKHSIAVRRGNRR